MSHIDTISRPAPASTSTRAALATPDAVLLDLCAKFDAAADAADAFGNLVNGMPGNHDQAAACQKLDRALSHTVDDIALQIARSRAITTAGLAAKARITRYAAVKAADAVKAFYDGGAIAIALAQSLLADMQAK